MKTNHLYMAIGLCLSLPPPVLAASLPEIRVEDSVIQDPSQETLETQKDSRSPSADSGEWLRKLNGISGKRLGGRGVDPVVRGQSDNRVNILLDGAYVHGGCPNRMDPPSSYAPLHSYESVTVIKGSQSVLYGGGGSGGTILMERDTPAFADGESPRLALDAGFAGNGERNELFADAAVGNAQGFLRFIAGRSDANNYEDGDGNEVRTAYTETGGNVIAGWTPDANTRLEASMEASRGRDTLFAGGMDSPVSDHDIVRLKFSRENLQGFAEQIQAEVYYSDVHHVMNNYSLRALTAPMKMEVPSDSITRGGRVSIDHFNDAGTLWTFGMDLQRNDREAIRYAGPTLAMSNSLLWPDVQSEQIGLFSQTTLDLSRQTRLSAGLRYDRVEAQAHRAAESPTAMGMLSPNQLYTLYYNRIADRHRENNLGGFIKLEEDFNTPQPLTAYVNISRSVRTADATERYMAANGTMPSMRWIGNPDIDPEQHHQLELGFATQPGPWTVSASLYADYVRDFILRDTARLQDGIALADGATIYRNVDARLLGSELELTRHWNERWFSEFTLAYVRGRNTDDHSDLAQIPPLDFSLSLEYQAGNWNAGSRIRGALRQTHVDDDPGNGSGLDLGETPGYAVVDVYGSWQLQKQWMLRWGIDNLLDKTYAEHLNRANDFEPVQVQINEPGRSIWLKGSVTF